jgi:uncharacterized coiled-coil protein SlyX
MNSFSDQSVSDSAGGAAESSDGRQLQVTMLDSEVEPDPDQTAPMDDYAKENLPQRIRGMESELALGKRTVHEALKAVNELETRLMKEHQQNAKVTDKFVDLKKKVVALTREERRLTDATAKQEERVMRVERSRDEYHRLYHNLLMDQDRLRLKLGQGPAQQDPEMMAIGNGDEERYSDAGSYVGSRTGSQYGGTPQRRSMAMSRSLQGSPMGSPRPRR